MKAACGEMNASYGVMNKEEFKDAERIGIYFLKNKKSRSDISGVGPVVKPCEGF